MVIRLRQACRFTNDILAATYELGGDNFEKLCVECLRLSGFREVFVMAVSDDGGIDIFGRLSIRPPDSGVPNGLLRTTLLAAWDTSPSQQVN